MPSILQFLLRFGSFFVFVILEIICFYLIIHLNDRQASIFDRTVLNINGYVQSQFSDTRAYLSLRTRMDSLREEMATIYERKHGTVQIVKGVRDSILAIDSFYKYQYISAPIVSKTLQYRNNYILCEVQDNDPVHIGMGAVVPQGVVGIVRESTQHYVKVLPIIHSESNISAEIQHNGYFGNIQWDGKDSRYAQLNAIPKHAQIEVGDTVTTSGYSAVFPKNIPIGTIADYKLPHGSNFYEISVELFVNFGNVTHLYLLYNTDTTRRKIIESLHTYED